MPQLSLLNTSSLAFPGRTPSVDSSVLFSCVAANGNLINLATGKPGAIAGTIGGRITNFGPTAFETGTGAVNAVNFAGQITALSTCTYSAIVRFNAFGVAQLNPVFSTSNTTSGATLGLGNFNVNQGVLSVTHYGGTNFNSSYSVPLAVPHFIWASQINTSGTTFVVNFVARNLNTGQTYSSTTSNTSTLTTANGTFQAFCIASNTGFNGQCDIAAAAIENVGLPIAAGLQRAADPWAFWYPRSVLQSLDWLTAGVTAPPPFMTGGAPLVFT